MPWAVLVVPVLRITTGDTVASIKSIHHACMLLEKMLLFVGSTHVSNLVLYHFRKLAWRVVGVEMATW